MRETRCNLCGSLYYKVIYRIEGASRTSLKQAYKITEDEANQYPFRIVRCFKCGLIYISPRANIRKTYQSYRDMRDEIYINEERGRRISARIILKKISKYRRGGKILDIGCATGFLLDEARNQGWQIYGVELSKWAVNFARQNFNLNVFEGVLKNAGFPYNYFDVIVMVDSIEHLPDPRKTLEEIRHILKPNGILCISTPDIDSLTSKILQAKWWGIKQSHLFYFSKKTLAKMLDATGFNVVKYSAHARVFSINYWNNRIKNYNIFLYKIFDFVSKYFLLKNSLIKLSFRDQIEVFAQKKRRLEFIYEDEKRDRLISRRMKTIVVLPAYNAGKTLELTVKDIPKDLVDDIILVDDASKDDTVKIAKKLGLKVFVHYKNKGYGANQKLCYTKALELGADVAVMVHPDYQYDPRVIPQLIEPIQKGQADAVFGSRMMKGGALEGGMPLWKHNANILLTALENVVLGTYLTEYHSGFRAYSAKYLKSVNFMLNSDGFIFDTEIIIQGLFKYMRIEEIPIRTRYFDEASTIKFWPSVIYGLGILKALFKCILYIKGIVQFRQFE
jgi:2-polyprenyl-3-methyl-5-hydroxy-6-metoxy-1,4-benzoquinol methylase